MVDIRKKVRESKPTRNLTKLDPRKQIHGEIDVAKVVITNTHFFKVAYLKLPRAVIVRVPGGQFFPITPTK